MNTKGRIAIAVAVLGLAGILASCNDDDATVASSNLSKAADNFEVPRQIVEYNDILGEPTRTIEGMCNIVDEGQQLEITCKVEGGYVKHFWGASDNTHYEVFQTAPVGVSTAHYRVTFKPESVIPDVNPQGAFE